MLNICTSEDFVPHKLISKYEKITKIKLEKLLKLKSFLLK